MQVIEPVTGLAILLAAIAIALGLFFDFMNGFGDSSDRTAAVIMSGSVSPTRAFLLAAAGNFAGAFLLGTAVARTISQRIIDPSFLGERSVGAFVIIAALLGAIVWNFLARRLRVPSSLSYALIGGLVGAFLIAWGFQPIHWLKVLLIVVIMLIAPLVGFAVARIFAKVAVRFSGLFGHRADRSFKNMQAVSLAAQTFSCGANEAQKAMGVIAFTLVIVGINVLRAGDSVVIPWWVIALCSLGIAAGVMAGGWRAIKAVGVRSRKVKPTRAFAPQMASAFVIYTFTIFGYPLSTAQVISSSTAEADVASRFKAVCWRLVKDSGFVCFVNIIASGVLAALCFIIFKLLFNIS